MKKNLILYNFLASLLTGFIAYISPEHFWQPLLINVSTTFFAIAIGIIVVNVYLDRNSRRGAVISILLLSHRAIDSFHDMFLNMILTRFSKTEFSELHIAYWRAGGDIMTATPENRAKIYELAKSRSNDLNILIQNLDESLSEITGLVGWDLDSELLEYTLKARNAIRVYRKINFDDSVEAIKQVSEHLIDIDSFSYHVRNRLMDLCGIKDA